MSKMRQAERFRRAAKKALVDRGISITDLASRLGYARNTVSMVINGSTKRNGDFKCPGVRKAVANELEFSV